MYKITVLITAFQNRGAKGSSVSSPRQVTSLPQLVQLLRNHLQILLQVHVFGERLLEHSLHPTVDFLEVLVSFVLDEVH